MQEPNYEALGQGLKLYTDSMRRFLKEKLTAFYHGNWWEAGVIKALAGEQRTNVELNVKRSPERDKIDHLDAPHLERVVTGNFDGALRGIFPNYKKTLSWLMRVSVARNEYAHPRSGDMLADDVADALYQMWQILASAGLKEAAEVERLRNAVLQPDPAAAEAPGGQSGLLPSIEHLREWLPGQRYLSEQQTKQAVVERMLGVLGWDIHDPNEVLCEYAVGDRRPDYCLRADGKDKVFIEAKKMGERLESHEEQLLSYCFRRGIGLGVLTNGSLWYLYLPLRPGDWAERRFCVVDILKDEPAVATSRLQAFLSRESVASGKAVESAEKTQREQEQVRTISQTLPKAWNRMISDGDGSLLGRLSEATEELCTYRPGDEVLREFLVNNRERLTLPVTAVSLISIDKGTAKSGTIAKRSNQWYLISDATKTPHGIGELRKLVSSYMTERELARWDELDSARDHNRHAKIQLPVLNRLVKANIIALTSAPPHARLSSTGTSHSTRRRNMPDRSATSSGDGRGHQGKNSWYLASDSSKTMHPLNDLRQLPHLTDGERTRWDELTNARDHNRHGKIQLPILRRLVHAGVVVAPNAKR
ncbi:MAG: hypothetical protein HYX92_20130 [Chloroflexi bacterium]|nr:hypothetical protein [Chloroflexota bacterium]